MQIWKSVVFLRLTVVRVFIYCKSKYYIMKDLESYLFPVGIMLHLFQKDVLPAL